MFQEKIEKIKASPNTKSGLIYTTNYIAKTVSCAFADDPNDELKEYNVENSSEALVNCLNQFFVKCTHTRQISQKTREELTVDEVSKFKEDCLLGRSVGLEILGRLLYCTDEKESNYFEDEKVLQLAQLDWSRKSHLWQGNVVFSNSNLGSQPNSYRITASVTAVKIAVNNAKKHLGWL